MIMVLAVTISSWLLVMLGVIVLNTVPAFMPPTWALLTYAHIHEGMSIWALAGVGAVGSTAGRALLALGSRHFGQWIVPRRWRRNVEALVEIIRARRALSLSSLALFALGPVPTNHLFIAAGIAATPLTPLLLVFGLTRFVSYLLWISAANKVATSIGDAVRPSWGNGTALAIQLLGFALLILVMQVDWRRFINRQAAHEPARPEPGHHGNE